jgi:Txe/YoeB family toxin of toxin-antitoxin system
VVTWRLVYTKQAQKDAKKLAASNLRNRAQELLDIVRSNPYQNPPPYEKLVGDLAGAYSRRINIQHRLVYEVMLDVEQTVKILRLWTHYE